MDTKKLNRKYYLHRIIKKAKIRISSSGKTIYLPSEQDATKAMLELQDNYQYNIQLEIPT